MGDRWGDAGPPAEAYSRVSDPDRYARPHPAARDLLDELARRFLVTRETATESDPHGGGSAPVVRLAPADPAASTLTVVFTSFPGLLVRMGLTETLQLPACGCDACDETTEECAELLRERIDAVTEGTFGGRLVHDGSWWHEHWYHTRDGGGSSRDRIDRVRLRALRAEMPGDEQRWAPWPQR
ncbi:DUF6226 family protein [Amycolatopsis palatopharyngis]|uniref:DUF6226 family protein n=1 Tax=Amycolatopsis palatopharyngis TaxID=187982 RepID=UPI000E21FE11|nr:DUF6226 family protein [Amycolatopsis palatopharyngis]